jgi:type IV secretion system protein VirB1
MVGFVDIAQHCAPSIGVSTIAAIVRTESGFNPLAIGVNVKKNEVRPKFAKPQTAADAITTAKWLLANGYNIDMGLGQINSANLHRLGVSVDDMFNPCANITAAGTILKGNYQSASLVASNDNAALYAAISAYNTGDFSKGFKNGYVKTVLNNGSTNLAVNNVDIKVPDLPANNISSDFKIPENKPQQSSAIIETPKKEADIAAVDTGEQAKSAKPVIMVFDNEAPSSMVY